MRFLILALSPAIVTQARFGEGPHGVNRHLELSDALTVGVKEIKDQVDENEKNVTENAAKIEANKNMIEQNTLDIAENKIAIEANANVSQGIKNATEQNKIDIEENMNEIELRKVDIAGLIANYTQLTLQIEELLTRVEALEPPTTTESPQPPPGPCPGYEFTINEESSKEYCYSNEKLTRYEHDAQAEEWGGTLASIHNKAVNLAIFYKIKQIRDLNDLPGHKEYGYFIGGTILDELFHGGVYRVVWADGSDDSGKNDFGDWNPWEGGKPTNRGPTKSIKVWKSNGNWAGVSNGSENFAVYAK